MSEASIYKPHLLMTISALFQTSRTQRDCHSFLAEDKTEEYQGGLRGRSKAVQRVLCYGKPVTGGTRDFGDLPSTASAPRQEQIHNPGRQGGSVSMGGTRVRKSFDPLHGERGN
jgi:hypothetical protein